SGLRATLLATGQFDEAVAIARDELAAYFPGNGDSDSDGQRTARIAALDTVAHALKEAGAATHAAPFFDEALALLVFAAKANGSRGGAGGDAVDWASTALLAAACHVAAGDIQRTAELVDDVVRQVRHATDLPVDRSAAFVSDAVDLVDACVEGNARHVA